MSGRGGRRAKAPDRAFDSISTVMAAVDRWLIPIGWMLGLLFFGLGLGILPIFTEGGAWGCSRWVHRSWR